MLDCFCVQLTNSFSSRSERKPELVTAGTAERQFYLVFHMSYDEALILYGFILIGQLRDDRKWQGHRLDSNPGPLQWGPPSLCACDVHATSRAARTARIWSCPWAALPVLSCRVKKLRHQWDKNKKTRAAITNIYLTAWWQVWARSSPPG